MRTVRRSKPDFLQQTSQRYSQGHRRTRRAHQLPRPPRTRCSRHHPHRYLRVHQVQKNRGQGTSTSLVISARIDALLSRHGERRWRHKKVKSASKTRKRRMCSGCRNARNRERPSSSKIASFEARTTVPRAASRGLPTLMYMDIYPAAVDNTKWSAISSSGGQHEMSYMSDVRHRAPSVTVH